MQTVNRCATMATAEPSQLPAPDDLYPNMISKDFLRAQ